MFRARCGGGNDTKRCTSARSGGVVPFAGIAPLASDRRRRVRVQIASGGTGTVSWQKRNHARNDREVAVAAYPQDAIPGASLSDAATRSGALQSLADAAHRREQRREHFPILPSARTPASQQIDLHEVHRIDVRIAQHDRTLHGRLSVEESRTSTQLEDLFAA